MLSTNVQTRSLWAVFFANIIFGFSFLFTKVSLELATPFVLLTARFLVAFLILSVIMLFRRQKFTLKGKPWKLLLLLGLFHPILYFIGETYGVLYTSSTFSAILIALIPIVSLLASALFLKEAPTKLQSLFCSLSVLGVILITAGSNQGENQWLGVILLLLAVFSDVAFNLLSRKISVAFTPLERTYIMFVMGFFVFFVLMLGESGGSIAPLVGAFCNPLLRTSVLYLGIASSVFAFFLLNYANTYLPVTRTIVFVNVTTLVTVVGGVLILREPLTLTSCLSAILIVLGVWGVQRFADRSSKESLASESWEDL